MTIGQLAVRAGVGVETVRFYERRGLVPQPPRPDSGFREYPPEAVDRIVFIRRAKELGFSLREIGELLNLRVEGGASCSAVKGRAETKVTDIDRKIAALRRMKRTLGKLIVACEARASTADCPMLDALDGRER